MQFEIENPIKMQRAIAELCAFLEKQSVPSESIFNARLAANELVGNVLKHSGGTARLRGEVKENFVELTVFSSVPFTPPQKSVCSDVYAEHGRGLYLVDSVCEARTVTADGGIAVRIKIK